VVGVAPVVGALGAGGTDLHGIYLWHWPVFLALNADRTGRVGVELFGWRCLATFAMAVLSYVLVERPIRAGGGGVLRRRRGAISAPPPSARSPRSRFSRS
jgi:peptidoglycan/LPS O-acetylase OafA/YrhL